jgi:hypothetical protein
VASELCPHPDETVGAAAAREEGLDGDAVSRPDTVDVRRHGDDLAAQLVARTLPRMRGLSPAGCQSTDRGHCRRCRDLVLDEDLPRLEDEIGHLLHDKLSPER